ncbi:Tat pathway signal sequence domain protein [Kribbella speibonae]|uniref:Tat pathway signal sequence domain protein n=1 Tax=Kribbella speibonae TaxID=1572660 RepID=A0ABY2A6W9_9ACTN|nr:Tat pathway signal sequence domain protein [Kribbella speibonae]TCC22971.1 Tat pathway signal sequence domain protein [Kribbella speibonae]
MEVSRRTVLAGMAAVPAVSLLDNIQPATAAEVQEVKLTWLEGKPTTAAVTTWGTPWPKGAVPANQSFALKSADGTDVPLQSWPTAYWPDGSLKWSAHAIAVDAPAESYTLGPGTATAPARPVTVKNEKLYVDVDTGVIRTRIRKSGPEVVSQIWRGDVLIAHKGVLVNLKQDKIAEDETGGAVRDRYESDIQKVTVEQAGPVRAVVKVEGRHKSRKGLTWLPFSVRLYFVAGAENVRMVHTFVYDRDGQKDYIAGLGVRFSVPMRDAAYDRHVRFVGEGHGMVSEAVKGITGLRRDPGAVVRAAQIAGTKLPDPATWDQRVTTRLQYIPEWGDYSLSQLTADGFTVKKRTKKGYGWVSVDQGKRASGLGYVGGVSGGFAFGLRDFWQRHPTQLDVRNAATEEAEVTVWLWSPEAGAMDTRFYHDGMGQDTYPEQLEGLNITYEDYEPAFGTPYGIARTSELTFWALEATPSAARLGDLADQVRTPPQLINPVDQLVSSRVFGGLFTPVDRSVPAKKAIEDHLDFLFDYYRGQVESRHWYGFWDYGDIMHTFDEDRLVWRYDVGGYAWDNSELSPDLWLWYAFLRSGRADIFRFAEAMTRHTGEVDVYHLGQWAGLGTRHGVQHWADSAKQQRISTAAYRRFYYYLTADERTGDLLSELVDSDKTFLVLDPLRKIRTEPYTPDPHALSIGLGTDWSGLAAAWLTEWERQGPKAAVAKAKLLGTMETIGAMPNGFVTGSGLYDLDTGRFAPVAEKIVSVSHLSAMFGEVEICAELIDLVEMPAFEAAWLQYCRLFNGTRAEQTEECGAYFGNLILRQGHARLTAYAAVRLNRDDLAARAWKDFYTGDGYAPNLPWTAEDVTTTLNPTQSAKWVSTNTTALYGLAAIQTLALVGDQIVNP